MTTPPFLDYVTPSSTADGLIAEDVEGRILTCLSVVASGQNPDGSTWSGGGGGGTGTVTSVTAADTTLVQTGTDTINPAFARAALTGDVTAAAASNATVLTNSANVQAVIAENVTSLAPLASPALSGTPTAPTAAVGTDTTQLATTAFVVAQIPFMTSGGPYSPTATAATTANGVAMGINFLVTPVTTGKLTMQFSGVASTDTAITTVSLQGRWALVKTGTATYTNASNVITFAAIGNGDNGKLVIGPNIPAASYVGTVTAGVSFKLSSSPSSQVDVSPTGSGGAISLQGPGNGAPAATGAAFPQPQFTVKPAAITQEVPFTATVNLSGLVVGDTYWFDLFVNTGTAADTAYVIAMAWALESN